MTSIACLTCGLALWLANSGYGPISPSPPSPTARWEYRQVPARIGRQLCCLPSTRKRSKHPSAGRRFTRVAASASAPTSRNAFSKDPAPVARFPHSSAARRARALTCSAAPAFHMAFSKYATEAGRSSATSVPGSRAQEHRDLLARHQLNLLRTKFISRYSKLATSHGSSHATLMAGSRSNSVSTSRHQIPATL